MRDCRQSRPTQWLPKTALPYQRTGSTFRYDGLLVVQFNLLYKTEDYLVRSLYLCKLVLLTRNHRDFSKIPGLLIEVVTV
ncbi:hypothetical protein [Tolypothrix sp. VBCCA 56010]|uniref:hypothetical protein n=1 Tax=Tolypothrix sp. VBCCA 56010 TaxID=3137731 RepID=UPI003D7D517A